MRAAVVAVIGPGDDDLDPELEKTAEAVGAGLASAGATVVCGGLGGVMAAAARGATVGGGSAIGFLPGDDAAAANRWLTQAIPTGLGEGRNLLVVRSAGAVIAVGGGYGTLSEIAFALKLGRPVIGIGTWMLGHPRGLADPILRAGDAAEAVRLALRAGAG